MSIEAALQLPDPPDLLRRFVPTPYERCIQCDRLHVHLRTNEPRLIEKFSPKKSCGSGEVLWTMVCDPELPAGLNEPLLIESHATTVLSFGRACFVALDREQRNTTGFMSAGISDEEWSEVIVPAVLKAIANDSGTI